MKNTLIFLAAFAPSFIFAQNRAAFLQRIEALEVAVFGGCNPVKVFMPTKRTVTQIILTPCKRGTPEIRVKRPIFREKVLIVYPPTSTNGKIQAFKIKVGKKWMEETYSEPTTFIIKKR